MVVLVYLEARVVINNTTSGTQLRGIGVLIVKHKLRDGEVVCKAARQRFEGTA